MPFGLGLFELLFSLLIFGAPVALLVLIVKLVLERIGPGARRTTLQNQQLTAQLQDAQKRLDALEARVARVASDEENPALPREARQA